MKWVVLILIIGACRPVQAAEVCQTVSLATFTQAQKNALAATAIELLEAAGSPSVLTRWSNQTGQVCFDSPTVDLATTLTPRKLLDRYALDEAAREQARLIFEQQQQTLRQEQATNTLCTATLAEIESRLDGISTIPQVVTAMKQIAKCVKARGDLRQ